jgi:hypothetical protein
MRLPGRNAPSSVEEAAAHLRASMGTARRGRYSLAELRDREREVFKAWFDGQGRVLREDPTLSLDQRQAHGEHCVVFHPETMSWWKTTHPGKCGIGAEFHYDDLPPFAITSISARELLPSEYLDRLILHNREFGDDIRVEGYVDGPLPSLVISQPGIEGGPATADQMERAMCFFGLPAAPRPACRKNRINLLLSSRKSNRTFRRPSGEFLLFRGDHASCGWHHSSHQQRFRTPMAFRPDGWA